MPIVLELSQHEVKQLLTLLDAAVRGAGLTAATMAVAIAAKIEQASSAVAEDERKGL